MSAYLMIGKAETGTLVILRSIVRIRRIFDRRFMIIRRRIDKKACLKRATYAITGQPIN